MPQSKELPKTCPKCPSETILVRFLAEVTVERTNGVYRQEVDIMGCTTVQQITEVFCPDCGHTFRKSAALQDLANEGFQYPGREPPEKEGTSG